MFRCNASRRECVHRVFSAPAGIVFGWPAMQALLEREGVYADLCPRVPVADCNAASLKYNAIFNAGSFGSTGGALLFGVLFDKFGPRLTSIVGHAMLIAGLIMFAFSSNHRMAGVWSALPPGVTCVSCECSGPVSAGVLDHRLGGQPHPAGCTAHVQ